MGKPRKTDRPYVFGAKPGTPAEKKEQENSQKAMSSFNLVMNSLKELKNDYMPNNLEKEDAGDPEPLRFD